MMATLALALLALYLLVGDPLLGRRAYRRMRAAVDSGNAASRLRFYLAWVWQAWLLLAVALVVTLGVAGWSARRLGLTWPTNLHWHATSLASGSIMGFFAGLVIAAVAGVVVGLVIQRRRQRTPAPTRAPRANAAVLALLPRTRPERWGFAALSVSAGITEEVVWRGFGLTLLFALLPDAHAFVPIVLAAAAFGWGHCYQGLSGMLTTALLGGILATLFWATGSLLIPIVLHVLIDLRALWVRVPASPVMEEQA